MSATNTDTEQCSYQRH